MPDESLEYPLTFKSRSGGTVSLHKDFAEGIWRVQYQPKGKNVWYTYPITAEVKVVESLSQRFSFYDFLDGIVRSKACLELADFRDNQESYGKLTRRFGANFNFIEALGMAERITPARTKPHLYERQQIDFNALLHAARTDAPVEAEPKAHTTGSELKSLRIQQVGTLDDLEIEFAPRLNLLTGDNGLGKTFLMEVVWWALTRDWAGYPAWPQQGKSIHPIIETYRQDEHGAELSSSHYDFSKQTWDVGSSPPTKRSLVLYARVDGSFALYDPARNTPGQLPGPTSSTERPATYQFTAEELWNGTNFCNGLINDVAKWYFQKSPQWSVLNNVLRVLSPSEDEQMSLGKPLRISLDDPRDIPTLKMPYGRIPVVHASAGVKRILGLAYLLVWAGNEHLEAAKLLTWPSPVKHFVLLLDEVEAHLHPQWQRLILPSLMQVVEQLRLKSDLQLIAATHAPLVLASIEPYFEKGQDELFLFELRDRKVHFAPLDWQRHGDASNWLTSEVFGLNQARSKEAEKALQEAEALVDTPTPSPERIQQIRERLRAVLSEDDPFWADWMWVTTRRSPQ